MIMALHRMGLRVVFDTVYNHTFHSGIDGALAFELVVVMCILQDAMSAYRHLKWQNRSAHRSTCLTCLQPQARQLLLSALRVVTGIQTKQALRRLTVPWHAGVQSRFAIFDKCVPGVPCVFGNFVLSLYAAPLLCMLVCAAIQALWCADQSLIARADSVASHLRSHTKVSEHL